MVAEPLVGVASVAVASWIGLIGAIVLLAGWGRS